MKKVGVVLVILILISVSVFAQQSHPLNQVEPGLSQDAGTNKFTFYSSSTANLDYVLGGKATEVTAIKNTYGIYGYSESTSANAAGIFGEGQQTGVRGKSSNIGVWGWSTGIGHAGYFTATGTGHSGYFSGGKGIYEACPSGFLSIESGSTSFNQLGCMQNDEEGSTDYHSASSTCFNTYGGRLPTSEEWYLAMVTYDFGPDENDNAERVSDYCWTTSGNEYHGSVGLANPTNGCIPDGNAAAYRCWIPR